LNYFTVPAELNNQNLVDADAAVYVASSSGLPTIQVYRTRGTTNMLSTAITIDANELTSFDAVAQPVIDTGQDDVVTGDLLVFNVSVAGTGTMGLDVILVFATP
jgi:hypothetical protein